MRIFVALVNATYITIFLFIEKLQYFWYYQAMNDTEVIYLSVFIIMLFIALVAGILYNKKKYEESIYFQSTKIPFWHIRHDLGRYGEFLIYDYLKEMELEGAKFLFNIYIPTCNNKTTEIDVIMIATQGIFVFESKNYSGWIFGTETQRKWTQSLHIGYGDTQKEHFFNPIMQNEYHIKYLKKILNMDTNFYSVVVFSNDCEFKNITRKSDSTTYLIYRSELYKTIQHIKAINANVLSISDIETLYNKLYSYSQVDELIKEKHIINLRNISNQKNKED